MRPNRHRKVEGPKVAGGKEGLGRHIRDGLGCFGIRARKVFRGTLVGHEQQGWGPGLEGN